MTNVIDLAAIRAASHHAAFFARHDEAQRLGCDPRLIVMRDARRSLPAALHAYALASPAGSERGRIAYRLYCTLLIVARVTCLGA